MRYRFYTCDVFTDRIFGGNPLAVLPEAEGLTTEQMQQITREFNYSETVFVLPPHDPAHARRLRIFTPAVEIPFAGHPTVGTAHVLAAIGEMRLKGEVTDLVFEEGVGPVPVSIRTNTAGEPVFSQLTAARLPEFGPPPPSPEAVAAALSLDVADLLAGGADMQSASCGVPYLFVPVRDRQVLARVRLDVAAWERGVADYWAPDVYVMTYDAEQPGFHVRARMFAPEFGVLEDPATGSAAAAMAGYLGVRDDTTDGMLRWRVEQGFEMGRPSIIEVEADKAEGEITNVRVGGASVMVSEGWLDLGGRA